MSENRIPRYLCGALSGGRDHDWAFPIIVRTVKREGGDILDPHVADLGEAKKLRETLGKDGMGEYDFKKMRQAKWGLAEISSRSTGVGIEIAYLALHVQVPVRGLRFTGSDYDSALVTRAEHELPEDRFKVLTYSSAQELEEHIIGFMSYVRELRNG